MSTSHPKPVASANKKAAEKSVTPKAEASKKAAEASRKAAKSDSPKAASGNFLLYPPQSPVDVPNFPHPDPALDETAKQSQPVENDKAESNWADDGTPAPYAKNARSSLL
jgi:hypothetical protein